MDGCRICGGVTRRGRRVCAACSAHLGEYETLASGPADLPIPVRRYGSAPAPAPEEPDTDLLLTDVPPPAPPAPRRGPRRALVLALACAGAALGGAAALAALLAP